MPLYLLDSHVMLWLRPLPSSLERREGLLRIAVRQTCTKSKLTYRRVPVLDLEINGQRQREIGNLSPFGPLELARVCGRCCVLRRKTDVGDGGGVFGARDCWDRTNEVSHCADVFLGQSIARRGGANMLR